MKQKLLAVLVALVMAVSLSVPAFAAPEFLYQNGPGVLLTLPSIPSLLQESHPALPYADYYARIFNDWILLTAIHSNDGFIISFWNRSAIPPRELGCGVNENPGDAPPGFPFTIFRFFVYHNP